MLPIKSLRAGLVHLTQAALLLAAISSTAVAESADEEIASTQHYGPFYIFSVDVVQNGTDFFFEGDVNEAGFPAKGTPFVTTGYIYPAGTLAKYGSSSGILENGEPEFPELVIGNWICRGWHTLDGDAETGIVVATTQTFDFDDNRPGRHMLVTNGVELADFNVPFVRPITGGSGVFGRYSGQMKQTYLDFNASNGFNMTFKISRR